MSVFIFAPHLADTKTVSALRIGCRADIAVYVRRLPYALSLGSPSLDHNGSELPQSWELGVIN